MTDSMEATLLKQFVRFRIPLECKSVVDAITSATTSRHERYKVELADLESRLSQQHPRFIPYQEFIAKKRELAAHFERDRMAIEQDASQPHYQAWRATFEDYRKLAVAQTIASEPVAFGIEQDDSHFGDDHWHYGIIMGCAESLAEQLGKEPPRSISAKARFAADYINEQIRTGQFVPQSGNAEKTVSCGTIRDWWMKNKDDEARALPSYIRRYLHYGEQFKLAEQAAIRLTKHL